MADQGGTPRYRDDFPALLDRIDLRTLEDETAVVYGLSGDLTINYMNPAWFRFAAENGGEPDISDRFGLGTPVGSVMDDASRDFYLGLYRNVLRLNAVWEQAYECSTAKVFRLFHQTMYPMRNGAALLLVNSLVTEQPHDPQTRPPHEPRQQTYIKPNGLITMCSHCRRVERADDPGIWDWVPAWVENMPDNSSHSLCRPCFDYYYKHHV